MKTIALNCNHCGAPLSVSVGARFATCSFCETQLAIESTGSACSTRILRQLQKSTESISSELEELRLRGRLERLDREWDRKKHELLGKEYGDPPTVAGSDGAIVLCLFAICGIVVAATAGFPAIFLLPAGATLIIAISNRVKAESYEDAYASYRRRHCKIAQQIHDYEASSHDAEQSYPDAATPSKFDLVNNVSTTEQPALPLNEMPVVR